MSPELAHGSDSRSDKRFLIGLIVLAVLFAAIPSIVGLMGTPPGGAYLGYQYNTDDHMVYSAWMRQAMDGRFLMDNRFTTDAQPSLTINIYFFILGNLARIVGIPLASTLARLVFSALFIVLCRRLVSRLQWESTTARIALVFAVVGGGLGFLVWHTFGVAIVRPTPPFFSDLLGGNLPTDVWQPEGFVFPSMLTNGLFMVSLCLILFAMQCLLDAKESWKPVLPGALALCLLMNIHSYDVLIIALVMVGFLVATFVRKEVTTQWCLRAAAIAAGALPSALWFMHVLKADAVFQARAGTDTPSASFKAVLFGYLPLMLLALAGLALRPTPDDNLRKRRLAGVGIAAVLFVGMFIAAGSSTGKYFLDMSGWLIVTLAALGSTALLADENSTVNLLVAWALMGTTMIYFPGLFQRKLAMGLSIPWAILAAYGLEAGLRKQEGSIKTLGSAFAAILIGATSVRWLARELQFIRDNTSRTSIQTVYLDPSAHKIVDYLNTLQGRHVLIAPPGVPSAAFRDGSQEGGQVATTPLIPDLNPIVSGLTGIYTYAGHWSETPDYSKRRSLVQKIYFGKLDPSATAELIAQTTADYAIALNPKAFPIEGLTDMQSLGKIVVDGAQFQLIHLKPVVATAPKP
jgi:arabinosyltransferase C